jgi:hypothetical protein
MYQFQMELQVVSEEFYENISKCLDRGDFVKKALGKIFQTQKVCTDLH